MKIETLEIAGLAGALTAVRLPFGKDTRSTIHANCPKRENTQGNYPFISEMSIRVDPKDLDLIGTLVKRGTEHAKVTRGIMVWAKITAPRMWWQEFDTYRIGVEKLSSESTMHMIGMRELTVNDFSVNDIVREALTPLPTPKSWDTTLHFDKPEKLECRILHKYGRDYEVWNNGDIYALEFVSEDKMPNGNIRKRTFPKTKLKIGGTKSPSGYFQVGIGGKKGKIEMVHRIIAEAFVPNPENKPFVNHIDGDKGNCSPANLEWCTSAENNAHARQHGLNKQTIRSRYLTYKGLLKYSEDETATWEVLKAGGKTYDEIAKMTNVSKGVIENYVLYDGLCGGSEITSYFREANALEQTISEINRLAMLYNETKEADILYDIKALLPESFNQTRIAMLSYQCLRNIYKQRHNHRLQEWHQFCDWIRNLPFAEELILNGLEINEKQI